MTLAGAWLAKEVQHLVTVDEIELGQCKNTVAIERRLEGEVKTRQGLDVGQAAHLERGLDPAALAQGELLVEQGIDRLEWGDLAALELAHQVIEDLKGPRHLPTNEVAG